MFQFLRTLPSKITELEILCISLSSGPDFKYIVFVIFIIEDICCESIGSNQLRHFGPLLSRGPPGDLYVYLDVEEIPEIQRDGINLCSTVTISYIDAILGAVVKVNHFTSFYMPIVLFLPT